MKKLANIIYIKTFSYTYRLNIPFKRKISHYKNNLLLIFFLISLFSVLLSGERTSIIIFFLSNLIMVFGLNFYRKILFSKKSIFCIIIFLIFSVYSVIEYLIELFIKLLIKYLIMTE